MRVKLNEKMVGHRILNKRSNNAKKENAKKFRYLSLNKKQKSNTKKVRENNIFTRFKKYISNIFRNKNKLASSYYLLLIGMFALATTSVVITTKAYGIFSKENYTVYGSIDNKGKNNNTDEKTNDKNIVEQSNQTNNIDTINKNAEQTAVAVSTKTNTSTKTNNTKVSSTPKVEPLVFSKPLSGQIIKPYSVDKVVYSKTLELWKTHNAIDISGQLGESVKSIERGLVEKVYEDSFYGFTIIIDHGQGYRSIYSNLDKEVLVKAKQNIKKGQSIGKVGNSSIGEIKDEPHIHFQLYKDSKLVDPTNIF
ncbi:MAG: M23 family metallopeptidase [Clostridia bacterium]|nr:M23 family metallopeptidase [Clostridia bacterium]